MKLDTIRADSVRKGRFRPLADIAFDLLPAIMIVANLLAITANGEEALQLSYLRLEIGDPSRDLQAGRQLIHVDRLGKEVVRAGFHAFEIMFLSGPGRQHDDIGILLPVLRPDPPAELEPVEFGHHPIGNDKPGLFPDERLPRVFPVLRRNRLMTELLQLGEEHDPGYFIVFGDKHSPRLSLSL